jgi:hypothetical protein
LSTPARATSDRIIALPYRSPARAESVGRAIVETLAASTDGWASSTATAAVASAREPASRVRISGPSDVVTNAASGTPSPAVASASVCSSAAVRSASRAAGMPASSAD